MIVIAPWRHEYHPHPIDCWRVLPEGMEALFRWAGLNLIEVGRDGEDTFGVAGLVPTWGIRE